MEAHIIDGFDLSLSNAYLKIEQTGLSLANHKKEHRDFNDTHSTNHLAGIMHAASQYVG